MANTKFDAKSFNPEAFRYMVGRVPNLKMNEIVKSKALVRNPDVQAAFGGQNGTAYARIAMRGLLDGEAVNYDGATDIEATSTKTFEQGMVAVGRAKAWVEKDFSFDITGGVDFMQNVADQVAEYFDTLDQQTILAILSGVFAMSGAKNQEFVEKHTYDVTAQGDGKITATTLNSAANQACGANKKKFSLVFMHSDVATNLENLNLVAHLKYTDSEGVQRDLELYTWNGKLVVIDDDMPVEEVAAEPETPAVGKEGEAGYTPAVPATPAYTKYTTYIMGAGAFTFEDIGAKVPVEMDRDPAKNGGEDTLYVRQRKVFAPYGISYEKKSQASLSPTDAELKMGQNWTLVHSGETQENKRTYINHKAIPLARIISRG
jgi:hypothetical protein